jgi:hypothetical protein
MAGLHGGGLPKITEDGWQAETVALEWPAFTLLLISPGSWLYGRNYGRPDDFSKLAEESELRAFGFSWTGLSLIIATSSETKIYSRA